MRVGDTSPFEHTDISTPGVKLYSRVSCRLSRCRDTPDRPTYRRCGMRCALCALRTVAVLEYADAVPRPVPRDCAARCTCRLPSSVPYPLHLQIAPLAPFIRLAARRREFIYVQSQLRFTGVRFWRCVLPMGLPMGLNGTGHTYTYIDYLSLSCGVW